MTVLTDTQVVTASGGLVELGYSQITADLNITGTTFPATQSIVGPLTFVSDGSALLIEFCNNQSLAQATQQNVASLFIDGSEYTRYFGILNNPHATIGLYHGLGVLQRRVTLSAGSHTVEIRGQVTGGTSTYFASSATTGAAPTFLRVSKIVQATQWPAVTTGSIICTSSTRPASPFAGQQIYETDTSKSLIYNGTAWVSPQAQTVPPMCRIARTSGQSFSNTVWDFVTGWTEIFDTDNMWTSANNYIEIQTAGVYLVQYGGAYAINGTADRLVGISRNDTVAGNSCIHSANQDAIAVSDTSMQGSFLFNLAALDKLRFHSYQNSGGALLLGTANNGYAYMSALLVGKTA